MRPERIPMWWRLRRLLASIIRPLHRRLLQHVPVDDCWERVTSALVRPHLFGPGSRREFAWYFDGDSTVKVRAVEDVCRWLTLCQYSPDEELFNEADFWQHPRTFEQLRKGDCEDHALWAWRKLIELGHRAEFFVGQWSAGDVDPNSRHAWVVFEQNGERLLLEAVNKEAALMIRPLRDVRDEYSPHFSVDQALKMHSYGGYLLYVRKRDTAQEGW